MFCTKCGADNSDTAVYCRKCGVLMEAEEETRVAVRRTEDESFTVPEAGAAARRSSGDPAGIYHPAAEAAPFLNKVGSREGADEAEVFSIRPTLMFVKMGYILAAIGALLLVAVTSAFFDQFVSISLSVLIGLLLFLVPAFYHVKQKLVRYTLTDSNLEIETGLISRTTRNVPIQRIQDVTVSVTPWQRLLGFGDMVIDNASEQGGKLVLKNINTPKKYADVLLKQMRLLER